MTIRPASDRSLLISFGEEISVTTHRQVLQLTSALVGATGILNLHPAFASVLVEFDPRRLTHEEVEALILERIATASHREPELGRLIEIPVSFGGEAGPDLDLEDVRRSATLRSEELEDDLAGRVARSRPLVRGEDVRPHLA